jgi:plasmid maintenance system antidote protein VapI
MIIYENKINQDILGKRIACGMKSKKISQIKLSKSSSGAVSPGTINYVLQGTRAIKLPMAVALERAGVNTALHWMKLQNEIDINRYKNNFYFRNNDL